MIVRCQQCQKAYELPTEVSSNPILDKGSYGWWLECDGCQAFWWEDATAHKTQKFSEAAVHQTPQPSVNDSLSISKTNDNDLDFDKKIFSSFSVPEQHIKQQPKLSIPTEPEWPIGNSGYIKTRASTPKRFLGVAFVLIFLTLTVIAIAFYLYRDGILDVTRILSYRPPITTSHARSDSDSELNLKIRDVKYDVQVVGNRKTVLVIGEIYNPHKPLITIKPLQIVVWGNCKNNNEVDLGPKQNLCKIVSWNHEWNKAYINSGEALPFQTVGSIKLEDNVVKVDVTLP